MNKHSYTEAYEEIQEIANRLENEETPLEQLAEQLKKANELLEYCEKKLREIETGMP